MRLRGGKKMKRIISSILVVLLCVASAFGAYYYQQRRLDDLKSKNEGLAKELAAAQAIDSATTNNEQADPTSYTSKKGIKIAVIAPASGSKVVSPLEVKGSVPGSWSFEGRFTVRLVDADGKVLDEQPATLSGDWMTTDMVQFSVTLTYKAPASASGSLMLIKANPSGLAANDDSLTIPLQF